MSLIATVLQIRLVLLFYARGPLAAARGNHKLCSNNRPFNEFDDIYIQHSVRRMSKLMNEFLVMAIEHFMRKHNVNFSRMLFDNSRKRVSATVGRV